MANLLCKLFGHRWRMLGWHQSTHAVGTPGSSSTAWSCDRCGKEEIKQWDW